MTIDEAIAAQAAALGKAVDDRLAADPRTAGLVLPSTFRIEPEASGKLRIRYGGGRYAPGTPLTQVDDGWDANRPDAIRPGTLDECVEAAHQSIRRAAQAHAPEDLPTWAVVCHPVALALALGHHPDRSVMPLCDSTHQHDPGRHWTLDDEGLASQEGRIGTAVANTVMVHGQIQFVSFGLLGSFADGRLGSFQYSDAGWARLSLPVRMPETAIMGSIGQRFGDVVEIYRCGYPEVDAAAAATVIRSISELPGGVEIVFERTEFIPYGVPPTADLARAMALDPDEG